MNNIQHRIITGATLIALLFLFFIVPVWCTTFGIIAMLITIFIVEWPRLFTPSDPLQWYLIPFYPTISCFLMILLNHHEQFRILLPITIGITFSFDTGSFIAGKLYGTHIIARTISPYKTWEGFLGGYCFSYATANLITWFFTTTVLPTSFLIFHSIFTLCALAGDFFESHLKRRARIKDTSSLLPGHGGLLDRFDSVFFVIILVYLCKNYLLAILIGK